ncbi:MAG: M42 family peptidase [Oscillospiraceae bacterium]|jgi:endoglucanase|nr:M42 family peptidase [Oscillospiraceae bacterium]
MLELLKTLCALSGVSGDEGAVREFVTEYAQKYAHETFVDALGNVIVTVSGARRSSQKIAFAAHMDEVGLIATHVTDDGMIKFSCVGGIDKRVLPGKRVWFGEVAGVIGMKPVHLVPKPDRERAIDVADLYVDIGATSKETALQHISLGDTATFDADFLEFGDGFVRSKAIDDRVGCAALLKLMENAPIDCTLVFTVQEEVGTRGARVAAHRVQPDIAVILEGTTAADLAGVSDAKKVCKLGNGAVSPFMDGGAIYDRELWNLARDTAAKHDIKWQTKEYVSGGTDGAAFQKAASGAKIVGIAAPVRNLHSAACIAKLSDIEDVLALARAFLAEIADRYGE